jgi:hypothetical protein
MPCGWFALFRSTVTTALLADVPTPFVIASWRQPGQLPSRYLIAFLDRVHDEGDFWETRSLEWLTKEIGEQRAVLATVFDALKDAMDEAPIAGYPIFEHG